MNFIPSNGWPQLKDIPEKLEHFREVYARFAKVNRWYQSIEETELTGNPVIFEKALKLNATALSLNMLPIQSGSGDPSPENVRPISGRTSVNLGRSGKNLCGEIENGAINTSDGQNVPNATTYRTKDYIPVEYGTTYNINNLLAYSQATRVFFYDANKGYISNDTYLGTGASTGISVTVNVANAKFVRFHANQVIMTNTTPVQVEQGNAPTAYEAPHIITLTIALGTTVYGGTLDVKTGVLTITDVIVDMGTLTWNKFTFQSNIYFGTTIDNIKRPATSSILPNVISDSYKVATGANIVTGAVEYAIGVATNESYLMIRDSRYTDADELTTALDGVYACYELATPTTIQLTGAELALLMGYNYISTDADSLTVKAYTI